MNHSSDKCQPALVHALIPVNPSIRRTRPSPASRLPSCAQNFLPNLTHSLVNSRLTLLHLYVPLTFQRIGQRGDSYRLPTARIRLPFARCPCTKPAICAGAVNHPHHTNCVNHSSDKCQRALVHALIPAQPLHPPHAASTRPAPRRARPSPASRLPSCAQNSYAQSLVNSRVTLVHLEVSSTFQRIGQRGDFYRLPAARIRLRFARFSCMKPAICVGAVNHPHHIIT